MNELQKNAIAEGRRKELETFQRALDIQWLNNRMEDGRMGRCLALIQREADMEKDFQEKTDHAAIVNARAEKEAALGMEVAKVQREQACDLQRRHYLRETDPSLKELAKKLQAGYVCRDLRLQIQNNEYKRLQEKAEEQHANDVLRKALYSYEEASLREEAEKKQRTSQYCLDLQQQQVNIQRQKQCQFEDTLVEKKMLDDIMRTISDEDQRELQKKRAEMEKMRREMVTFAQAREAWRCKQKALGVIEEQKLEEQRHAAADRSAGIVAERERKMQMKEDLNAKIVAKILSDEAERQLRVDIIKQLQEQEYLETNANNDIAMRDKLERVKKETKDALTAQMETKKKVVREQKITENKFRLDAEAKVAADNAKELDKERKKKEKNRLYFQELRKQIEDNDRRRKIEHQREEGRALQVWDYDKAGRKEVSGERNKIIEEHAPHLLGYLQAGVLKDEDLPALKTGAARHEETAQLDIGALAASTKTRRFPKCNEQCRVIREY